jgi:hypothetical protein
MSRWPASSVGDPPARWSRPRRNSVFRRGRARHRAHRWRCLLRDLDRLLSEETGLHVQVADDPLTCVARGGGRALELVDMHGNEFFAPE